MLFEANISLLYSDTQIPDVFITEYMPSMESDFVKVYLHCLFLGKYNKQAAPEDISKKLDLTPDRVKEALMHLESLGILVRKSNRTVMMDLKEKEILKLYRPKSTSTPEEAAASSERNKKRNSTISAINNTFFQGVMSPSWYTDIDSWFDKYKFEEDVMVALFQHCYDHRGMTRQYIMKVADNWSNKNIKNSFDLDRYFIESQKTMDIRYRIAKKLKTGRNLTEDEEEYIDKWVVNFQYGIEILNLAFKEAVGKRNPFKFVDAILTGWHEKGLKSLDDVRAHLATRAAQSQKQSGKQGPGDNGIPQHSNFDQRKYDKDYFDKIYNAYDE